MTAAEDVAVGRRRSPMRKYEKWLGHWKPEYDSITSENEIVLMVSRTLTSCAW